MAGLVEPWLPQAVRDLASHGFQQAFRAGVGLIELNCVPDFVVRRGIRFLLSQRLAEVLPGCLDNHPTHLLKSACTRDQLVSCLMHQQGLWCTRSSGQLAGRVPAALPGRGTCTSYVRSRTGC